MPESGGPTTQSGILYQNSITALYLGRLLDPVSRVDSERVELVRTEAPQRVDDTVVQFADGHTVYVQAKENIRSSSPEWGRLWTHFDEQYRQESFQQGQDRLLLWIGNIRNEHDALREICERATGADSYSEWEARLNNVQLNLLENLKPNLVSTGLSNEHVMQLFQHIDVEVMTLKALERDVIHRWMPQTNKTAIAIFRLLRDRVGGEARVRGVFTARELRQSIEVESNYEVTFETPSDFDELRSAIVAVGSLLRQHPNKFGSTDIHIQREIAIQITKWLLSDGDDKKNVAMLLDQAGMGKTVVMRDVLEQLDNQTDVLAIKADQQLTDVATLSDIQNRLGLPDAVESIVSRLAQERRVVVLIDQIDSLSLSLAHDQSTLNIALDLAARLRRIPNVRILLSCRIFDRNSDPRLKAIEIEKTFDIVKLTKEEVNNVLSHLGIELAQLTRTTRDLLRIPLHLDLFARAIANGVQVDQVRGIGSLQELYTNIWNNIVMRNEMGSPRKADRIAIIERMTDFMDKRQQIFVPDTWIISTEIKEPDIVIRWLASAGIVIQNPNGFSFLHQSFFDYCYARKFVNEGGNIVEAILRSEQGLNERPKLLQVIAYLRGNDPNHYLQALNGLLEADTLRYHLRDLILRWFGAISNPTDDEWQLANRLFRRKAWKWQIISVMHGSSGWFPFVKGLIENLLESSNPVDVEHSFSYLFSLRRTNSAEVVKITLPYAQNSSVHKDAARRVLFEDPLWQNEGVQRLYEELVYSSERVGHEQILHLDYIAHTAPKPACRVVRHILDVMLLDYKLNQINLRYKDDSEMYFTSSLLFDQLRDFEHYLPDIFDHLSRVEPEYFITQMLPWCQIVVEEHSDSSHIKERYAQDLLSYNWYDDTSRIQLAFVHSLIAALTYLAEHNAKRWLSITRELEQSDFATPHQLLTHVYRQFSSKYAEQIFDYLTAEQRRLVIGYSAEYDTRELMKSVTPHLNEKQLELLESKILNYRSVIPNSTSGKLAWLRHSGIEQYRLLNAISPKYLSKSGLKHYSELQRKFPDYEIEEHPATGVWKRVNSPIEEEKVVKMSDESWLRAFQKYRHGIEHHEFLKGGASQLSQLLTDEVESEPERFSKLLSKVPSTVDRNYALAFIKGFAAAPDTSNECFTAIRHFIDGKDFEFKREIAWVIERLLPISIPDDIFAMLYRWATSEMDEDELWWSTGENHGSVADNLLNSDRGAAFFAVMRILDARDTNEAMAIKWELIERVVTDESVVLKVGAIQALRSLSRQDMQRAFKLFQELLIDSDNMFMVHDVREFLWSTMYKNFKGVKPYIWQMMNHADKSVQQRGAELACIASFSIEAMEDTQAQHAAISLEETVMQGQDIWRNGAARIYTHNMRGAKEVELRKYCVRKAINLLGDPSEQVTRYIDSAFISMGEKHFDELRPFLEAYAQSNCKKDSQYFSKYLWEHGMLDSEWSLTIIRKLLANGQLPSTYWPGAEDLMRFTLRIYRSNLKCDKTRMQALDIFDELMMNFSGTANILLEEWDRH